jgi:hypothetical protein
VRLSALCVKYLTNDRGPEVVIRVAPSLGGSMRKETPKGHLVFFSLILTTAVLAWWQASASSISRTTAEGLCNRHGGGMHPSGMGGKSSSCYYCATYHCYSINCDDEGCSITQLPPPSAKQPPGGGGGGGGSRTGGHNPPATGGTKQPPPSGGVKVNPVRPPTTSGNQQSPSGGTTVIPQHGGSH